MYFLLVISVLLTTANTALTKIFQRSVRFDFKSLSLYNLINALIACVFFSVSAGFRIGCDGKTLVYALVYAAIICVNLSVQIKALELVAVPLVTLMSVAGGVLLPSVFGIIYYREPLTLRLAVSAALILTATVLPLIGTQGDKRKLSPRAVLYCAVMFLLNGGSVILVQLYARDTGVQDSNSFFFLTNAMSVLICVGLLAVAQRGKPAFSRASVKELLGIFNRMQILNIAAKTALANACSVLQVLILRDMDASAYAVLNSSMSLVGSVVVSVLCFREKQNRKGVLAVLLAMAALIVNP